jgi:glucosylglycerate synthase
MATANPIPDPAHAPAPTGGRLLVLLTAAPHDQLENSLASLTSVFTEEELLIAAPEDFASSSYPDIKYLPVPASNPSWTLTAADFVHAYQLAEKNAARAILILGPGSGSLALPALRALADGVARNPTDLALPSYDLPPHAGLLNSAVLYPLSRAMFSGQARFPLGLDLGLSLRMGERLARTAQRLVSLHQGDAPIWPVNEAAVAGFSIQEFEAGPRILPQPAEPDLNVILPLVTGSLFSDIDAKAAFWQRARASFSTHDHATIAHPPAGDNPPDIASMLQAFRLAYSNLQEIWSLVLPPNSLLGLKRLYVSDAAAFRMPEALWARIVFDFLLAYRLRTINRKHLLGALIPLYLAWVASHVNITASGVNPEQHIEAVAAAFEAEKPYIVSRWRWPDRFNP